MLCCPFEDLCDLVVYMYCVSVHVCPGGPHVHVNVFGVFVFVRNVAGFLSLLLG